MTEPSDYDKHTDEELREGIDKAEAQDDRLESESSPDAVQAEREQRDAMREELRDRES